MSDDAQLEARINKFEQTFNKRIKALLSPKAPAKTRVESAAWLGESGDPRAIEPLVEIYEDKKNSGDLRNAAAYALGQFKALEKAVGADKSGSFETSLEDHPDIYKQLTDIVVKGQFGKRKSNGGLWFLALLLLISFGGLAFFNYTQMTDDEDDTQAIIAPTETPAPTATEEPILVDGMTATPEPTPTETPTPTPTVAPEEFAPYVREMSDAIDIITRPRGAVELLLQNWEDGRLSDRPLGCRDTIPEIPVDIFIPDTYLNTVTGLREAWTQVNLTLGLVREGWTGFFNACEAGTLQQTAQFMADSMITTINTTLSSARDTLLPLQMQTR